MDAVSRSLTIRVFTIMAVFGETLLLALVFASASGHSGRNLVLGGGVNVFKYFGDLTVTMRVSPRNDSDPNWLFREAPPPVFEDNVKRKKWADTAGRFSVELCDDLSELYRAFFGGIRIEGLDKDWEALTRSWTRSWAGAKLGVPEEFLDPGEYAFLLVELSRFIESGDLPANSPLSPQARLLSRSALLRDSDSVFELVRRLGTHYISSYVLGDSFFQVVVFEKGRYRALKANVGTINWSEVGSEAIHMGEIAAKSGNKVSTRWARKVLGRSGLLGLHTRPALLPALLSRLGPALLLRLRLALLDVLFRSRPAHRSWFRQLVLNRLALYEINA